MGQRLIALYFAASMLVACGGDKAAAHGSTQQDMALPKPGAVNGSVTGMPNPGIARTPPANAHSPTNIELRDQGQAGQGVANDSHLQSTPDSAPPGDTLMPHEPDVVMDAPADAARPDSTEVTEPIPLQP